MNDLQFFAWRDACGKQDIDFFDWPYCYLHGQAEDIMCNQNIDAAPDIFYANQPMPTQPGEYPATLYGTPVVAVISDYETRYGRKYEMGVKLYGRVYAVNDPIPENIQHCKTPKDWR